jgi:tetratricopeptide (TPR) repeat protein
MRAISGTMLISALLGSMALAQQSNPDQVLSQAIAEQQRGDYQSAIRDYRKVLDLRPNAVEAKVNLGVALAHVGDFDGAIAMYRSALPSVSQKNDVLRNLAFAYLQKKDFANAAEQYKILHQARPNDVGIATLLAYSDVQLGNAAAAVTLLEPLEAANSHNPDFEFTYGSALIKAGRRRDGVDRLENAAKLGNSADAYMLAGSTLLDLNDFEPARRNLDAALQLDPKLPGIYTLAGTARDKTGAVKEAEDAFREALKLNPNDFDANLYLGAILYKRRDLDQARPYLDRALQLNPTSSMARYEAAMYKSTAGDYAAAAQDLEKLTKDDPTWLEPHIELASLYYRLRRPEDGRKEREIVDRLTAEQQPKPPVKP